MVTLEQSLWFSMLKDRRNIWELRSPEKCVLRSAGSVRVDMAHLRIAVARVRSSGTKPRRSAWSESDNLLWCNTFNRNNWPMPYNWPHTFKQDVFKRFLEFYILVKPFANPKAQHLPSLQHLCRRLRGSMALALAEKVEVIKTSAW